MYFLAKEIRLKKKYKQPHSMQVTEYNIMAEKHNELNKGISILTGMYKNLKK